MSSPISALSLHERRESYTAEDISHYSVKYFLASYTTKSLFEKPYDTITKPFDELAGRTWPEPEDPATAQLFRQLEAVSNVGRLAVIRNQIYVSFGHTDPTPTWPELSSALQNPIAEYVLARFPQNNQVDFVEQTPLHITSTLGVTSA